ncbi:hypothetical protein ACRAQ6_02055 [Erythrobacter sp. HA6-11]
MARNYGYDFLTDPVSLYLELCCRNDRWNVMGAVGRVDCGVLASSFESVRGFESSFSAGTVNSTAPTLLSLTAIGYYVCITLACLLAFRTTVRAPLWHRAVWMGLGYLFIALTMLRIFSIEDLVREEVRGFLRGSQAYEIRRIPQAILAFCLMSAGLLILWRLKHFLQARMKGQRDRLCAAALLAGVAMVGLVFLRMISWHTTDWLLYGPLKLNWLLDLGAASAIGLAALVYQRRANRKVRSP